MQPGDDDHSTGTIAYKATPERLLRFITAAWETPWQRSLREFYVSALNEISRPYAAGEGADPATLDWKSRRPINRLLEMVRSYTPHLLGTGIDPIVEPAGAGGRGEAALLQARLRRWVDDAGYGAEDEQATVDALIGVGCVYVGVLDEFMSLVYEARDTVDHGDPIAVRVGIDCMVLDPAAKSLDKCRSAGHLVSVDRDALRRVEGVNTDAVGRLSPAFEAAEEYRMGMPGEKDAYLDDRVILWVLHYHDRGVLHRCVLPLESSGVSEFIIPPTPVDGPEGLPYVFTRLDRLPGRPTPISPAMAMMDAHHAQAMVAAKMLSQIEELRRKYVVDPAGKRMMAELLDKQREGSYVFGNPALFKETVTGGLTEEIIGAYAWLESLGKQVGPNTDLAGGRDDPSTTATGTSILAGNATVALRRWSTLVQAARSMVLRRVAATLTRNPTPSTVPYEVAGTTVELAWNPAEQDLSYDQFKYRIRPSGSGAVMDGREKMRSIFEILTAVGPVLQTVAMLGGDPAKALGVIGDLSEMGELAEMIPTPDGDQLRQSLAMIAATQGARGVPTHAGMSAGPANRTGIMRSDRAAMAPS